MVGIVIVSHSAALADGVVELAREMGGEEVAIEPAGGIEGGAIGTDAERVREAAIERVRSPDGVLVLMDLGSALMSAEMAIEMADPDGGPIVLSRGAAGRGRRRGGRAGARRRGLEEVAREARGALRMKQDAARGGGRVRRPRLPRRRPRPGRRPSCACASDNRLGLHARPAARVRGRARRARRARRRSPTRPAGAGRPTVAA